MLKECNIIIRNYLINYNCILFFSNDFSSIKQKGTIGSTSLRDMCLFYLLAKTRHY